jgi:hypothetical protein
MSTGGLAGDGVPAAACLPAAAGLLVRAGLLAGAGLLVRAGLLALFAIAFVVLAVVISGVR